MKICVLLFFAFVAVQARPGGHGRRGGKHHEVKEKMKELLSSSSACAEKERLVNAMLDMDKEQIHSILGIEMPEVPEEKKEWHEKKMEKKKLCFDSIKTQLQGADCERKVEVVSALISHDKDAAEQLSIDMSQCHHGGKGGRGHHRQGRRGHHGGKHHEVKEKIRERLSSSSSCSEKEPLINAMLDMDKEQIHSILGIEMEDKSDSSSEEKHMEKKKQCFDSIKSQLEGAGCDRKVEVMSAFVNHDKDAAEQLGIDMSQCHRGKGWKGGRGRQGRRRGQHHGQQYEGVKTAMQELLLNEASCQEKEDVLDAYFDMDWEALGSALGINLEVETDDHHDKARQCFRSIKKQLGTCDRKLQFVQAKLDHNREQMRSMNIDMSECSKGRKGWKGKRGGNRHH